MILNLTKDFNKYNTSFEAVINLPAPYREIVNTVPSKEESSVSRYTRLTLEVIELFWRQVSKETPDLTYDGRKVLLDIKLPYYTPLKDYLEKNGWKTYTKA